MSLASVALKSGSSFAVRFTFGLAALLALGEPAHAKAGPPGIPGDTAKIVLDHADCVRATADVMGGAQSEIEDLAKTLCELRAAHKAARDKLLGKLAKLVETFKDQTNHEHAQNLPDTIASIQHVVKECVAALESQQYCHNVGCNNLPEMNFTFCEDEASAIVDHILQ